MNSDTKPSAQSQAQSQNSFTDSELQAIRNEANRMAYQGGRSLNAIWYTDLVPTQKLILQFLGSDANFDGTFVEFMPVKRDTLAQFTGISLKTLDKHITELEDRGYLNVVRNKDEYGSPLPSEYSLTRKLFDDYVEKLVVMGVERRLTAKAASVKRIINNPIHNRKRGGSVKSSLGVAKNFRQGSVKSSPLFTPHQNSSQKTPDQINDDVIPISVVPEKTPPKVAKPKAASSSVSRDAVRYAKRLEWLYSKSRNGSYDWDKVNSAAEQFLKSVSKDFAEAVAQFAEKQFDWAGRVKINDRMFVCLAEDFERFVKLETSPSL